MKQLKILILSDYAFTKGGAEKVAITSSIGLVRRGHEVVFFSGVGPVCEELKKASFKDIICLNQKDILDNPNKLNAALSGIYNRQAVNRLKKLLSEWIPDIVHIHGVSKSLSWSPVNVIYSYNIPIVYTLHDYGLVCPNLGIYNFKTDKNCEYYKPGYILNCLLTDCDKRNYVQKLWRWFRFFITRYFFKINKKINTYIAVSNFIRKIIKENLASNKHFKIIYNPIEQIKVKSKKVEKEDHRNKVKFLFVGRLSIEKGIDILLEAMEQVDAELVVIGEGELIGICKEKSKEMGRDKIKVLGYQNREVIAEQMLKSHALVLPSKCMEPAPLVIGEASFNFLPSIVSDHGGLTEFISDGENGLYFEAGDKNSLIKAMNKIVKDQKLSTRLGMKARKLIKEKGLSIDNYMSNIESIYQDILGYKKW